MMTTISYICLAAVAIAVIAALFVIARVMFAFWWTFAYKQCPHCSSKRSRFLTYTRLDEPFVVYSAHRCKRCKTEFIVSDGKVQLRDAGTWRDDSCWLSPQ